MHMNITNSYEPKRAGSGPLPESEAVRHELKCDRGRISARPGPRRRDPIMPIQGSVI